MNVLRRLLFGCKRSEKYEFPPLDSNSRQSKKVPTIGLDLYFDDKSQDFGLLMDLLAEASGVVQSLR